MVGAANLRQQQKLLVPAAEIVDSSSRSQELDRRSGRDEGRAAGGRRNDDGRGIGGKTTKGDCKVCLGKTPRQPALRNDPSLPGCQCGVTVSVRGAA